MSIKSTATLNKQIKHFNGKFNTRLTFFPQMVNKSESIPATHLYGEGAHLAVAP